MDRYEVAQRIARAILNDGRSSLSDSEESAMREKDFSTLVDTLLQKYRRVQLLQSDEKTVVRGDPFDKVVSLGLVQWESSEIAREAQLWSHTTTKRIVLEIKEWGIAAFHGAQNVGAHAIRFQQTLKGDREAVLDRCDTVLHDYGCPPEKISAFRAEAQDSLQRVTLA